MKDARAKRAKILFFIDEYANLWGFCCRRRRGCLSSPITKPQHAKTRQRKNITCTGFYNEVNPIRGTWRRYN